MGDECLALRDETLYRESGQLVFVTVCHCLTFLTTHSENFVYSCPFCLDFTCIVIQSILHFFFTSTLGLKEDLPYTALYHKHKITPPPSRVKDNIIASPCPLNKQDDEYGFAISHDQL